MKKLFLLVALIAGVMTLTACDSGGDDDNDTLIVQSDRAITLDTTNGTTIVRGISGEVFTFTNGVASFGTTGTPTTVTITAPATAGGTPTFSISAGGRTATGTLGLGANSCTFTTTSSTFPSGPIASGASPVVIPNCSVTFDVGGLPADELSRDVGAILVLNTQQSQPATVTISVNRAGRLIVNGTDVGSVTLREATGLGF